MGRKWLRVSGDFMTMIATSGWKCEKIECIEGLPAGASLIDIDGDFDSAMLLYEHPDWPEEDGETPLLDVKHRVIYD